jgi:Domain of unknown function (DUF4157)
MSTRQSTRLAMSLTPTPLINGGGWLQRKCSCGGHADGGECEECGKKKSMLQRKATGPTTHDVAPPVVHDTLREPGSPLDVSARRSMEAYFGHDFARVRVHTNETAAESARAVNAHAYTVGSHIVFGAGQYAPDTAGGTRLLAHELTHVIQQRGPVDSSAPLVLGDVHDRAEGEASEAAAGVARSSDPPAGSHGAVRAETVQRQFITPLGPGGGYGGLMERYRPAAATGGPPPPGPSSPFHVCARDLQGVLGAVANHAYIEAPPYRYAIAILEPGNRDRLRSGRNRGDQADLRRPSLHVDGAIAPKQSKGYLQERGKGRQSFPSIDNGQAMGAVVGPYSWPTLQP